MNATYYDLRHGAYLDPEKDACSYSAWHSDWSSYALTMHPGGFAIFLRPDELARDEYSDGDPYHAEEGQASEWQARRLGCTLQLVGEACSLQHARALDLGCGKGWIAAQIKRAYPNLQICGLDRSLRAVQFASEHFRDIDFAVADAYSLPYADGYFDLVICNNIWEHVGDPITLLNGIRRVLRPGGALIVSTPSRYRIENLLRACLGKPTLLISRLHVTEYAVGQVVEQLRWGQFHVRRILSRPIKGEFATMRFRVRLLFNVMQPVLRMYLRAVGSEHSLESTVFYLAHRVETREVETHAGPEQRS